MKKTLAITTLSLIGFLTVPTTRANAATRCETQYGGTEVCVTTGNLQIDKEVWSNIEGKYVDNLGISSEKFTPNQEIKFRIRTKNVGDESFSKVEVKDTLPPILEKTSGDTTYDIKDLKPNETHEKEIKARVVENKNLPQDKSVICDVNTAEAKSGSESDKDTSQICVDKRILGTTLPETGSEGTLATLLTYSAIALSGLGIIKLNPRTT